MESRDKAMRISCIDGGIIYSFSTPDDGFYRMCSMKNPKAWIDSDDSIKLDKLRNLKDVVARGGESVDITLDEFTRLYYDTSSVP